MPTQLQLVNRCLAELGKLPVSSINDSYAAQYLANKLDELYPELLLACNWTWAIVYREDSTPLVNNFSPDYTYTYQLPGDFGKFYKWASSGAQWAIYEFVDGYLLAQTNPVQYYYIKSDASYEVFPPLMARALVLYASAESANALTQDVQLSAYLQNKYEKKLIEAILQNDMERSVTSTPYNDYDRISYY